MNIQWFVLGNCIQRCEGRDITMDISVILSNAIHQKIKFQPVFLTFRDLFEDHMAFPKPLNNLVRLNCQRFQIKPTKIPATLECYSCSGLHLHISNSYQKTKAYDWKIAQKILITSRAKCKREFFQSWECDTVGDLLLQWRSEWLMEF